MVTKAVECKQPRRYFAGTASALRESDG